MRCVFLALILCTAPADQARADLQPADLQGWFGLEMFADMNCTNNPVWIEIRLDTDRLDLRWRRTVAYADGSSTDTGTFRITSLSVGDLRATRLADGVPALFRFAPDLLSFTYFEGAGVDAPTDLDLLVTSVRCEFQGS